jgi:hypothetical protein
MLKPSPTYLAAHPFVNCIPSVSNCWIMSTEALKSEAPINSTLNSETSKRAKMSSDAPFDSTMYSQTPESANSLQNVNPPKTKTHYPLSF